MKTPFALALAAVLLVGASSVEAADKPPVEISGGVSMLDFNHCCGVPSTATIPLGWSGEVTFDVSDRFAVVANAGGDYQTRSMNFAGITTTERLRSFSADGGARVIVYHAQGFKVFAQTVLGVTRRSAVAVSSDGLSGQGAEVISLGNPVRVSMSASRDASPSGLKSVTD
jgi:hypothetical protein